MENFTEFYFGLSAADRNKIAVQIADACNVELNTVRTWAYHYRTPKSASKERIANILQRPVSELFPEN